jgi:hypothetical protein
MTAGSGGEGSLPVPISGRAVIADGSFDVLSSQPDPVDVRFNSFCDTLQVVLPILSLSWDNAGTGKRVDAPIDCFISSF